MQKNLLNEVTNKKDILCVDKNYNGILNLGTYNTLINSSELAGKSVKLYLPNDSKIVNATEIYIEMDFPLSFIYEIPIQQESNEETEETKEPIIVVTNENLKIPININDYNMNPEELIDRFIDSINSQTVVVHSVTSNSISFYDFLSFSYILKRDMKFENIFNTLITSLDSANPKYITRFECPTSNDFFSNYDVFTDIMIGYKSTYKDETDINTKVGLLNEFLLVEIDLLMTKNDFNNYYILYSNALNLIHSTIDEWIAYFERLKKLMAKMRIVDAYIDEEECQNLYNAKPVDSQADIDFIYNVYLENNKEDYIKYNQERLFEIKID